MKAIPILLFILFMSIAAVASPPVSGVDNGGERAAEEKSRKEYEQQSLKECLSRRGADDQENLDKCSYEKVLYHKFFQECFDRQQQQSGVRDAARCKVEATIKSQDAE
jgi:hypothetical protein